MWTFDTLKLVNFKSHSKTMVAFKQGHCTMVYGNNGSGKSSILSGCVWALVDMPDSTLPISEYIKDGENHCIIEGRLTNKFLKKRIKIVRHYYLKKARKAELWVNGELNEQLISAKAVNEEILNLLDISKEDLLNYFIISQDNSHSFFEATDTTKKRIVSRFSNSVILDIPKTTLEAELTQLLEDVGGFDKQTEKLQGKIETVDEQIVYEKETRFQELKDELEAIQTTIDDLNEELSVDEETLKEATDTLTQMRKRLGKLNVDEQEVIELTDKRDSFNKKIEEKAEKKNLLLRKVSRMKAAIAGSVACPNCQHEFVAGDEDVDVKAQRKLIKINKKKAANINTDDLLSKRDELVEKLDKKTAELREAATVQRKADRAKDTVVRMTKNVKNTKERIEILNSRLDKLNDFQENSENIRLLSKKKTTLESELDDVLCKKTTLIKRIEILNFWKINLGLKGFESWLINKVLVDIEGNVNFYLNKFNVDFEVKINGYKTLKGGDTVEQIDVLVSKDGGEWRNFKRFSGGQRQRVNVCGILALQKLINLSSNSGGLDFIGLDEFFEGLDLEGQMDVLPILEASQVTSLVISHHNNDIGATNQIQLDINDGESKLKAFYS